MAMKRRAPAQQGMWVAIHELPRSAGHVFYEKLNEVLASGGFDEFVEELCTPHYAAETGRPSIAPGVYFRMLFVGYFEGLSSQRGIAWRCADSLSLRAFLSVPLTAATPTHSSMTRIRQRLPEAVFEQVFTFVLRVARRYGLLRGKTIAVDSTTLEANAAMRSLVRRDTGEDWKSYVRGLLAAEGVAQPTDDEVRRLDRTRTKKTSNAEWVSATDPASRVAKMKDGRTHLAYKAEHALDVESQLLVAAVIYRGDDGDAETLPVTVELARQQLTAAGAPKRVEEVVADKGYHKTETLEILQAVQQVRPYIPEPKYRGRRRWRDKPAGQQALVYATRRRVRGARGRRLGRWRSERVERSIAHTCETGAARRSWLSGVAEVAKSYLGRAAAHNLAVIMLAVVGVGTARSLQAGMAFVCAVLSGLWGLQVLRSRSVAFATEPSRFPAVLSSAAWARPAATSSTGC